MWPAPDTNHAGDQHVRYVCRMSNPGEDTGATPPSDAGSGSEPTAAGYEAPPIEQTPPPGPSYPPPPAYGSYDPPPAYQQPDPAPQFPPPGQDAAGYSARSRPVPRSAGIRSHPDYSATGYPPPPPGYGAPGVPFGAPQFGSPRRRVIPRLPPPYGAAPGYGGYGPPPPAGTNSLAIGSLIASLVGVICGIGSIIGIVLGVIALNQIKQNNQGGRGLAIAGIAVGAAVTGDQLRVGLRAAVSDGPQQPAPGDPDGAGGLSGRRRVLPPPVYPGPPGAIRRRATPLPRLPGDPYRPANRRAPTARRSPHWSAPWPDWLFCGLPSVAGLVLGVIAMRETRRTGQDGYGLALAGAVIGGLITAGLVLLTLLWIGVVVSGFTLV